ncbi:semaphorin-4B-like isoform X1 [Simochromis diagramma]|uniref:semaphorin-4B-like isoform X1 n=1 Tax=Simochromis diagramma TaxID=43689 RepID=UPI001A7E514F|nr:semaphorin-4B-like isoform X1 [Simochromis diagramma]
MTFSGSWQFAVQLFYLSCWYQTNLCEKIEISDSTERPLLHFGHGDLHNTTALLLSRDSSTLYVGAQNAILSLDVNQSDVIRLNKKVQWSPSDKETSDCTGKGKDFMNECPNFIHVLQPLNSTHLYTCGSYAYSPQEAYIDTQSFSIVKKVSAKGRCPFSPFERSAVVIADGELFTATKTDFRGIKPQILRYFSKDGRPDVSLETSIRLLEEPTFVSSSLDPAEGKLYFFFSEVGKEFSYVDDLKTARVAQVCKDDVGGVRTLQKKWTSFTKATLLCQFEKQLPFNILQDVFTLPPPEGGDTAGTLFYGVFTTQWSRGPESAVCVFRLEDIKDVFKGSYRTFVTGTHQWSTQQETHSYLGTCGLGNSTDAVLGEVKKSFLTTNPVTPVSKGPVVVSSEQQYSRVAVMRARAANDEQHTLLFLITESGFLHKVVLLDQGPWVIEEIQVFAQPQTVQSVVLSTSKGVLYVGTSEGVTAVPVANCSTYTTCSQCLLARDPLCGWSRASRACARVHGGHEDMVQNLEDSNVEDKCQGQTEAEKITVVRAHMNEVVRLSCLTPSNLATLTWAFPQSEKLFIQSDDGSLSFVVTNDTSGVYRCEAEEAGYKQVVESYDVRLMRSRNLTPRTHETAGPDETYESIVTDDPTMSLTQLIHTNEYTTDDRKNGFTTSPTGKGTSKEHRGTNRNLQSSSSDTQYRVKLDDVTPKEKSYYGELVGVSLLLALCICIMILGSLHMWQKRKVSLGKDPLVTPEEGASINRPVEICSLSSRAELEPELKVE